MPQLHTQPGESLLPPSRGHVATEQRHPDATALDTLAVAQCVQLMVDDHHAVAQAAQGASPALSSFITALVFNVRRGGRLIYIGAGTSGRLGVLDASECPPTFQSDPDRIVGIIAGGDAALRRSSEGLEDDPDGAAENLAQLNLSAADTVLGIAAGGTTPYVLGALSLARQYGVTTGLLTCAAPAQTPQDCDHLIVLDTGPEILAGSTRLKAGSATKLALNIITTTLFVQLGKVYSNLMVDLRATNNKLLDRAIRIVCQLCPTTSRADAAALLQRADGSLKTAVVMQRLNIDAQAARQRLVRCEGKLREALQSSDASSGSSRSDR